MGGTLKAGLLIAALATTIAIAAPVHAQDSTKQDDMKPDKMMHGGTAKSL